MHLILDHDRCTLLQGDCRDLADLPDCSVDAIVTDPPYLLANASGKGFMGREWDSLKLESGETIGRAAERWHSMWGREALRILKPGGHLLAFGASRMVHRMLSGLEDVGFELRDVLFWCYGSGFPKSLDVAKQVDKSDAASERRRRALAFTEWMRSTGLTAAQINEATSTAMGSHYITEKKQPAVATREHLDLIVDWSLRSGRLIVVPEEIQELVGRRVVLSEQFAKREVVGTAMMTDTSEGRPGFSSPTFGGTGARTEVEITRAYTEAAQKWEGWGTALKPAYEPIGLLRKPPGDTVAACVLEHGTGGINVDACRIGDEVLHNHPARNRDGDVYELGMGADDEAEGTTAKGRWPANVILSHHDDCFYDTGDDGEMTSAIVCVPDCPLAIMESQSEGASRFFYCPKPTRAEKELGLDHLPAKLGSDVTGRKEGSAGSKHARAGAGAKGGARNTHVTVKPVALMRYLCRLVTPPGGTVLDVFAGSGTTGVAALAEGFSFIGVELGGDDGSHLPILIGRIRHALGLAPEVAAGTPDPVAS